VTLASQSTFWELEAGEALTALGTDARTGLSDEEAAARLRRGRNVLPEVPPPSLLALAGKQLRETMIVVLLVAGVLTALTNDLADTVIIALVVTLNTTLGVLQERRAQRAISALRDLTAPSARCVREGRTLLLPAADVVPGDVLVLEAGDLVPADGRVLEAQDLEADEAPLTGESLPSSKTHAPCGPASPIGDRRSMLHAGTVVTRGRGRVVVTATGTDTEVGRVARLLTTSVAPDTPLQRQLARFGQQVAAAVVLLSLVVMALGLLRGEGLERMVLTGISLAVAAVPESLPAVVVLSLALAAQRMAQRSAVVRTLPAVEALGSITVIATDKTGTLTEGLMTAESVWTPAGVVTADGDDALQGEPAAQAAAAPVLRAVVLCNDAQVLPDGRIAGDPMEGALLTLGARGGLDRDELEHAHPRLGSYPFDHERARMTTVHGLPGEAEVLVVCKGSPEVLLALLSADDPAAGLARTELEAMTAAGQRVLAVAESRQPGTPGTAAQAESGLRLLGLVGLRDRPRPQARDAVAGCLSAGVVPIMITGDHPATAAAIAADVGLLGPADLVVTGADVEGLDADQLARTRVFARVAPEQKLAIVQALQRTGQVVAMTGDGVNDGPALRAADIGVAMGRSGTEIARQAADVVLTDDDFGTVVAAVEEGRRVYDNIRRFLVYGLAGGSAEVMLMLGGPAVGLALPLLPGQILWVNMLTHGLPGVALGAEQGESGLLSRRPRDPKQGVLAAGVLPTALALGLVIATVTLGLGVWAHDAGRPWQTMVFVTLTLAQLWLAVTVRSTHRSALTVGFSGNPLLYAAIALNLVLLWLAVAWPPLADVLDTEPLTLLETGLCAVVSLAPALVLEVGKAVRRYRTRHAPPT
jgi:Ca2+-transporting ATPase